MSLVLSSGFPLPIAPYRLSGTVYGTLLNHRAALVALGDAVNHPPYKAPPKAPVLYVKPRNTLARSGAVVMVPTGVAELEVGACLAMVIGSTACHLTEREALAHVAGYLLMNDISVPHPDYYRPSVRYKARDGFCPLGEVSAASRVSNPNAVTLRIYVDDALVQSVSTADMIRSVQRLLVEVTEFMTLVPGDVLALGVAAPAPRVRAGQRVRIEADGLIALSNSFAGAA